MNIRFRFFLCCNDGYLVSAYDYSDWEVGKWRTTSGHGELCGRGWLHCYNTPRLAELHDPIHAEYWLHKNAVLWKVEVRGKELRDGYMKCGWTEMRPLEQIHRIHPTPTERVNYGIRCAKRAHENAYPADNWTRWADNWILGRDRTAKSAQNALLVVKASRCIEATKAAIILATIPVGPEPSRGQMQLALIRTQVAAKKSAMAAEFLQATRDPFDLDELAKDALIMA